MTHGAAIVMRLTIDASNVVCIVDIFSKSKHVSK